MRSPAASLYMSAPTFHTSVMAPQPEPAALLQRLRDDLGFRRIEHGIRTLENVRPLIESLDPKPQAGVLVGLIAQWVDAGFDTHDLLIGLLSRFPRAGRGSLPVFDYLHLRMAEAAVAMSREEFDRAIEHLLVVLAFEEELDDAELLAIANFWTGRCYRKMGRYDDSLKYTERGETLALACGYPQMAAIMQATRSWLAFQKGKLHDAMGLLARAETALNETDDFLNRGNIQSAYGRIARRQGKYERARRVLRARDSEYRTGGHAEMQLARTLLNLAFVKRLLALQVQRDLDLVAASRRGGGLIPPLSGPPGANSAGKLSFSARSPATIWKKRSLSTANAVISTALPVCTSTAAISTWMPAIWNARHPWLRKPMPTVPKSPTTSSWRALVPCSALWRMPLWTSRSATRRFTTRPRRHLPGMQ